MTSAPIVDRIRIIPRPGDFLDRTVGSSGEVFFNRATNSLRVYSGKDVGGFEIAKSDLSNVSNTIFAAKATAAGIGSGSSSGASISISATAPLNPQNGNLWLSTENGYLYVYINDGTSNQWIQPAVPQAPLPQLSTVAFTGNYNDLTNKPVIGGNGFSGSYNDLSDKPNIDALAPKASPTFTGSLISLGTSAFGSGLTQANLDLTPGGAVAVNVKGSLALTEGSILLYKPSGFEDAVPFGTALWTVGKTNLNDDFVITNQSSISIDVFRIGADTNEIFLNGSTTFSDLVTLKQTTEVVTAFTGATGTYAHDYSSGAVFYHSGMLSNFTANFTNVPTTNNRSVSVVMILNQGSTPYIPSSVTLNDSAVTVRWIDGVAPTGTANQTDVISLTFIRVGSAWQAIGSFSTYAEV